MNVLVVGSGGREHALAWKIAQSKKLSKLFMAPGNAGTSVAAENVVIPADDIPGLVRFSRQVHIDLVVVGPEVPLANGLTDALQAAGLKVFGPSQSAAQIEASKAFSKAFMARHNIPTARFATFEAYEPAADYLRAEMKQGAGVVIKASGLAAGKGVLVPETLPEAEAALRQVMLDREFGAAGDEVIIEEKLSGPEVSLLAFSDGVTVKPMLPAQDHKRIFDGDQGPNTGGMGAYSPVPVCPAEMVAELTRTILRPCVDGLRAEGRPFVGALYAGLMLTRQGPRVIEFNCRFGDPETQVLMTLLDTDLLEVALACAEGRLEKVVVRWRPGAAACVVLASGGYPGKYRTGHPISGLDRAYPNAAVFHAGTKSSGGQTVSVGGRVLNVTGWGSDIRSALAAAYAAVENIQFEGMHYRRDIGWQTLAGE